MMRFSLPLVLMLAVTAAPAWANDDGAPPDPATIATRVLDGMDAGDYAAASAPFSATLRAALGADKLAAVQGQLAAAGAITGRDAARIATEAGRTVVVIRIHRALANIDATVTIDGSHEVVGLHFAPAPSAPAAAVPADANFTERDASIGSGPRALPATLAMPRDREDARKAGAAAVVLVHGSGPQDRDESIGANRPFLDIARGLAAQGIAVLRYEKRTKAHPAEFARDDVTVDDETTDDAVAAVALLRATPGIDPARVYVLGHSQGGMLVPRIAQRSGHVAGLILLAAPARSLLTLLPEQNRYLLGLDGAISPAEKAHLDALDAQIAALRGTGPIEAKDALLGLPAHYWRTLEAIDPVADALALRQPILLLQGGRDFQVIDADWQRWQQALDGNPRATFHRYPSLNHLGIAGTGRGSPAEYQSAGHVDPQLIDDVAAWVRAR